MYSGEAASPRPLPRGAAELLNAADIPSGNTRVISQTALEHFRDALGTKQHDPFAVVLKQNKLPMSLLEESKKVRSAPVVRGLASLPRRLTSYAIA